MRILTPIIVILLAIGCFIWLINPAYQNVKALQAEVGQFNDALGQVAQLGVQRDRLLALRNSFTADDLDRLNKMVPDNVDNIRLLLDMQGIASRDNISLKNIEVAPTQAAAAATTAPGPDTASYGSVSLSFSAATSYGNLIQFLQDLERSLRLVEINSLSFSGGKTDQYDVSLELTTYWLKGTNASAPVTPAPLTTTN